jgi:NADH:ubiquinone oxidoreductase subunit 4 (subunit M)
LGVWRGGSLEVAGAVFGLNPASYYPIVALLAVFGIIITAAYILRAVGNVFFGEYDAGRWHDMRPLLTLDKVALAGFAFIMILIGLFPSVIAPMVESGMGPVVDRVQASSHIQPVTIIDTVQHTAMNLMNWLGGI